MMTAPYGAVDGTAGWLRSCHPPQLRGRYESESLSPGPRAACRRCRVPGKLLELARLVAAAGREPPHKP